VLGITGVALIRRRREEGGEEEEEEEEEDGARDRSIKSCDTGKAD